MWREFWLISALICFCAPALSWAGSCAGCVDLDEHNFDQVVKRFPYALIKFDVAFPYGDKHEAFAAFAKAALKNTEELLVATVGIKDYGENENKALGDRFKVDDKNFPEIVLFKGNVQDYIKLTSHLDITADNLKNFVSANTELYIGRDGCIKEFNELAHNYANLEDDLQLKVLAKAEELVQQLSKGSERVNGKSYVLFMRKIHELGYAFVEEETKRLLRLKAGKVHEAKKVELQHKLNILESFRVHRLTRDQPNGQDEL